MVLDLTNNTGGSVHGGGVSSTLGLGISPQSDETILAPSCSPTVPHDPEVSISGICSVSDQLDGVVQGNVGGVGAALVDSTTIGSPATGVDSDGKRSNIGEMFHDLLLVVGGEGVVSWQSNCWRHAIVVVAAVSGHSVKQCMASRPR